MKVNIKIIINYIKMYFPVVFLILVCSIGNTYAQNKIPHDDKSMERLKDDLSRDIRRNSDDIAILRRDQVNYKIEKDLLKESYSNNVQIITNVISIVSAAVAFIFAILGYMGFSSIGKIKEDYIAALDESNNLKNKLENEISALQDKQKQIEKQVKEVIGVNKNQARRIELLELVEKISSLIQVSNYNWAMEHIKEAMLIDPKFAPLLMLKSATETALKDYPMALVTYEEYFALDYKHSDVAIGNYTELVLLFGDRKIYDKLILKYKTVIESLHENNLIKLLDAIVLTKNGDISALKNYIRPIVQQAAPGNISRLGTWSITDIEEWLKEIPDGELKNLIHRISQFFVGQYSSEQLLQLL